MANRPIHVVESGGDSTGLKEFADGADSGVQLPSGTTAQRDSSASAGEIRFNSDNKKIEYYDGANWQSSSFINVDDAEYDGAFTIEGTDYSNQTAGESSGVQRPGNNGTWLDFGTSSQISNDSFWAFQTQNGNYNYSKFLPAGHDRAHAGLTGDEARFGPAGSNTTQAEITSRYTPIMEIATNVPQTSMGNSYENKQKAGALAFTTQTNDYIYSGFSQKFGGNKAFVSGVTNYMFGNSMGYYQNTAGVNNLLTFWNSNDRGGPIPWLTVGRAYYDIRENDISFFVGGTFQKSNPGMKVSIPNTRPIEAPLKMNTNFVLDWHPTGHTITDFNKAGQIGYLDDGSSNAIVYFAGAHANSRILPINVNSIDGKELQRFLFYDSSNSENKARDYKVIFYNSNNSNNKTLIINPTNLKVVGASYSFTVETNSSLLSGKHESVKTYAEAAALTTTSTQFFDSTFPSAGSQTSYTVTPKGIVTMNIVKYGSGNHMHILFENLNTQGL